MITVVANLKGGVGKSTIAFHLVTWLMENSVKTKAVDLDPQKTLTDIIEVREEEGIIPAIDHTTMSLMNVNHHLEDYEEVVVDVGAQSMVELKYAIIKADRIIIPVMPSQADIWATQRFMKLIRLLRTEGDMPQMLALVNRGDINPNNYDTSDTHEALGMMKDTVVLDDILYDRDDYRSALYEGMACFEFNPDGRAAIEFNQLANSVYNIA